jgi:photosystem II stability/assembly factor-like uncharacterized protein
VTFPALLLLAFLGWSPVGPERGSITAVDAGTAVVAGTAEGRLFTLDAQNEWRETAQLDGPVTSIAGTWVLAGDSLYRGGSRKLSDVRAFAVAPANALVVYAATASAILFSTDGGATWSTRPGGARSVDVDARDSSIVWAVRSNGAVEKSIDAGQTWTAMAIDGAIERVDAHPRRAGTAFAIGPNGLGFRTTDGLRWTRLYFLTGALTFDPHDDTHFFAVDSEGRLFHSDDDGDWLDIVHGGPILSLSFAAGGSLMAGFREDGVMLSNDGGISWTPHRKGLLAAQIHTLGAAPDGSIAYAGSVSSMFRTTNRGATWEPVFTLRLLPGPFAAIAIDPDDPNRAWIGAGVSMWFTGDGGVRFNRLFWAPDREPQTVTGAAFDPVDRRAVLVLMSQSLFRLHTEPLQLTELTPQRHPDDRFESLAVEGSSIWIGGARGSHALILHSPDGGRAWTDRSPSLPGSISALHASEGRLIAGSSSGHVIIDGVTHDLDAGPVKAIATSGATIFVAADRLVASIDGVTWQDMSAGLTGVTTLTSGSLRMAGTAGAGVFVYELVGSRRRAVGR